MAACCRQIIPVHLSDQISPRDTLSCCRQISPRDTLPCCRQISPRDTLPCCRQISPRDTLPCCRQISPRDTLPCCREVKQATNNNNILQFLAWGRYHGGRRQSSDYRFHSPTVIPPSALDKQSIMKRYHRRRTCSHTSSCRSPTMVTLHDTLFVECRW